MTLKIPAQTKRALVALARKYESPEFTDDDPSHILRAYKSRADIECAAFVMSALSFGRREQFMRKAGEIFTLAGAHPALWLKSGGWSETFGRGPKKFYRFYSFDDMRGLFARLQEILSRSKSFGDAEREEHGRAVSMSAGARVDYWRNVPRLPRSGAGKNVGEQAREHVLALDGQKKFSR